MTTRVLTGITPSGTPHLGNYVGAIRPAIAASRAPGIESFFFLADLHSLIKSQDPQRTQRATLEIAASWLACGLDPEHVWFYRQSDIRETTELMWFLTAIASKGILNRAHAYKAAVDKNREEGVDEDAGVSAGLFMYPVLMAADILIFKANQVPVGRDQIQHIEMARDFAQRFNHVYGKEYFPLPDVVIDEQVATLAGLDGRKMSKSYHNTIPLFVPREELKKLVFSILTDSRAPGEPKDTEGSALFQMYQALRVEFDVHRQNSRHRRIVQRAAMQLCTFQVQRLQCGQQAAVAVRPAIALAADGSHCIDLLEQVVGQFLHLFHTTVVGQVHRLRVVAQHALDRGLHRLWVELHRRRRREDESALRTVQLAVGDAEGIAGEPAAAARIPHAVVVQRVARRVQQDQLAAGQIDAVAVFGHHHTLLRNRLDATIAARDLLGTINGGGTGNQPGRIDHVRRAARVQHRLCVRQLLHQQAGAAGVVQVHVGQQQPVDRVHTQAGVRQRLQHGRH